MTEDDLRKVSSALAFGFDAFAVGLFSYGGYLIALDGGPRWLALLAGLLGWSVYKGVGLLSDWWDRRRGVEA